MEKKRRKIKTTNKKKKKFRDLGNLFTPDQVYNNYLPVIIMGPSPLQIKVNALKRLIKEEKLCKQEVAEQEQHVNQMKANNADEYELKKQIQVLEESQRMVPEVTKKITQYRQALREFLDSYKGDEDVTEAKELL